MNSKSDFVASPMQLEIESQFLSVISEMGAEIKRLTKERDDALIGWGKTEGTLVLLKRSILNAIAEATLPEDNNAE